MLGWRSIGVVVVCLICWFSMFAYTHSLLANIDRFSPVLSKFNSMKASQVRLLMLAVQRGGNMRRSVSSMINQIPSISFNVNRDASVIRSVHKASEVGNMPYAIPKPKSTKKAWTPKSTTKGRNLPSSLSSDDINPESEFSDEPLRLDQFHSGRVKFPIEENRDQRFHDETRLTADLTLTFIGTASCVPGINRGVSCVAMRYNSDIWLFDCGEGTQLQLKKSSIKFSKISKIFITHMHGDHAFGLAGVLCAIGQSRMLHNEGKTGNDEEVLDIYGPDGIRSYIRTIMQLTYSRVVVPHRIHELKNVPMLYSAASSTQFSDSVTTRPVSQYGERPGGQDIYPEKDGTYNLILDGIMEVRAAPMTHTVPCVGYSMTEKDRPGALLAHLVNDIVHRNSAELQNLYTRNGRVPMKVYEDLKNLKQEESFTFPDGTQVTGKEISNPPIKGRKIVYMGDTCNSDFMEPLAQDCDALIHEATNCYFAEDESTRFKNYWHLESYTRSHGHSTPEMAGRFAAKVNARQLLLTHFSPRYCGDASFPSMAVMWKIEDFAENAWTAALETEGRWKRWYQLWGESYGNTSNYEGSSKAGGKSKTANQLDKNAVVAAWDHLTLHVGQRMHRKNVRSKPVDI